MPQRYLVQYLTSSTITALEASSETRPTRAADGSVDGTIRVSTARIPRTQWAMQSHNAEHYGTALVKSLLGGRSFPFPKSLYAVEDALRLFLAEKPEAVVLDFFAGSGTTAHAVMRLNRQDGGRRRSISITNNEVAADEQVRLRAEGLRPGDPEWERLGICDYITKPRIAAAITGRTPSDNPIGGDYRFTDIFPISEGLKENVEFFTLTYESPRMVEHNRSFEAIAPLLWLRAGSAGSRIDKIPIVGYAIAETYGVLADVDESRSFVFELKLNTKAKMAFIVTNDDRQFQMVCAELPGHVAPVRLYESYLTNFAINQGGVL